MRRSSRSLRSSTSCACTHQRFRCAAGRPSMSRSPLCSTRGRRRSASSSASPLRMSSPSVVVGRSSPSAPRRPSMRRSHWKARASISSWRPAFEAGGHRPSFLRSPETSLTGLFSLLPQVCGAVDIPVIAAGGIADGRGVAAALALGADGVQIGTAFLACEESNAPPAHREALFGSRSAHTVLTRASPAASPGACATPWPTRSKTNRRRFCRIRCKASWQGHCATRQSKQAIWT